MYACNGILFNHESPTRGELFVTRKITRGLARIKYGMQSCLYLGNLNSRCEWGHARDYVEAQWLMPQQAAPEDFVITTGQQRSVREFVELAVQEIGMSIRWAGEGVQEKGFDPAGRCVVAVDPRHFSAHRGCNPVGRRDQGARKSWGGTRERVFTNWFRRWYERTWRRQSARNCSRLTVAPQARTSTRDCAGITACRQPCTTHLLSGRRSAFFDIQPGGIHRYDARRCHCPGDE